MRQLRIPLIEGYDTTATASSPPSILVNKEGDLPVFSYVGGAMITVLQNSDTEYPYFMSGNNKWCFSDSTVKYVLGKMAVSSASEADDLKTIYKWLQHPTTTSVGTTLGPGGSGRVPVSGGPGPGTTVMPPGPGVTTNGVNGFTECRQGINGFIECRQGTSPYAPINNSHTVAAPSGFIPCLSVPQTPPAPGTTVMPSGPGVTTNGVNGFTECRQGINGFIECRQGTSPYAPINNSHTVAAPSGFIPCLSVPQTPPAPVQSQPPVQSAPELLLNGLRPCSPPMSTTGPTSPPTAFKPPLGFNPASPMVTPAPSPSLSTNDPTPSPSVTYTIPVGLVLCSNSTPVPPASNPVTPAPSPAPPTPMTYALPAGLVLCSNSTPVPPVPPASNPVTQAPSPSLSTNDPTPSPSVTYTIPVGLVLCSNSTPVPPASSPAPTTPAPPTPMTYALPSGLVLCSGK